MSNTVFAPLKQIIKKKYSLDDISIEDGKTWLREDLEEIKKDREDKKFSIDETYNVIKVIEAWELTFHESKVIEHIHRASTEDTKNKLKELIEARWYLDRIISLTKAN